MGFTQRVAAADNWSSGGVTSVTATVGTATAAGGTILVATSSGNVAGTVSSLTDTAGNSYVLDFAADNPSGSGKNIEIWRCADNKALTTSDSISVTWSATMGQGIILIADQFTPLSAKDVSASAYQSSQATTVSATATATASDVVMYAAAFPNGTVTGLAPSSPFTACGTAVLPANGISGQTAYLLSPSGSETATFTWSTTHTCVETLTGYPAGAAKSALLLAFPF